MMHFHSYRTALTVTVSFHFILLIIINRLSKQQKMLLV